MDYPKFIVSNQKGDPLVYKGLNALNLSDTQLLKTTKNKQNGNKTKQKKNNNYYPLVSFIGFVAQNWSQFLVIIEFHI